MVGYRAWPVTLNTLFQDLNIIQCQLGFYVIQKPGFFPLLSKRWNVWSGRAMARYTGQARTRANIQNHTRWQQIYYRQTVEQMTGDHGIQAPDRSQVVGLVPTVHQIKVGQQRVLLGICRQTPSCASLVAAAPAPIQALEAC